jgi:diacylglycerol O-acyltransferase / wax synthase
VGRRGLLRRPIGADRRLAVVRGRLEVAGQVAHAHHAKVNDVVLAAVAGGLRRLLAGRGEDPDGLVLRVMVPVSLHREEPGRASGNRSLPRQRTVNLSVTNVPGPPVPLYLAGARLLELFPVVSLMGNLTLGVAVLSCDGQLNLTAVADRDTCPDVEVFAQGVRSALDDLERSALVPTS